MLLFFRCNLLSITGECLPVHLKYYKAEVYVRTNPGTIAERTYIHPVSFRPGPVYSPANVAREQFNEKVLHFNYS